MFSIKDIAKKGKPGDTVRSHAWREDLTAEIVEINEEGVLLKGEHLVNDGFYLAEFAKHKPDWKGWSLFRSE